MTDTDIDVEHLARRIADRGQDALVSRLRQAYADAAAAHADLISLDSGQIEAMVQAAAENADGVQWRRALAGVASEELGISVTEALTHPVVTRAQALVGAPSYEQSLAELIARPVPEPAPSAMLPEPAPEPAPSAMLPEPAPEPEPAPAAVLPEPVPPVPPVPAPEPPAPEPEPEPQPEPPMPGPSVATPQSVSTADSALPPTVEHQSMPVAAPVGEEATEPVAQPADELERVEADDVVLELLPEPDPIEYETEVYDVEATFSEEHPHEPEPYAAPAATAVDPHAGAEPESAAVQGSPPAPGDDEPDDAEADGAELDESELVIPAIHLGGVANLPTKREGLGVRLSVDGLDILQGEREIIGRLMWDEIEALEVPNLRARRRRHEPRARLVVRTPHGDASFDVPGISADELRDRVEPLVGLYAQH